MVKRLVTLVTALVLLLSLAPAPAWITPTAAAASPDLKGRIIILDAGHGAGNSPGYGNYIEHAAMFKLANKIKPLLEARGATVLFTRPTEEQVSIFMRVSLINKWALEAVREARRRDVVYAQTEQEAEGYKAHIDEIDRLLRLLQEIMSDDDKYAPIYFNEPYDYSYKRKIHPELQKILEYQNDPEIRDRFLCISLHSNATSGSIDTLTNGADAFYAANDNPKYSAYYSNYSFSAPSYYFGDKVLDNIAALGIRKREVAKSYFTMVREHNVPGVLIENGFHTNAADRAKLSDDAFLDKLALAYEHAIADYFLSFVGPLPNSILTEDVKNALKAKLMPERPLANGSLVITRADFCAMAVYLYESVTGLTIKGRIKFLDTKDVNVEKIAFLGVIEGNGDNRFYPDGKITREQAAVILARLAEVLGLALEKKPATFADTASFSWWSLGAVGQMQASGIMQGTGNNIFSPKEHITLKVCLTALIRLSRQLI